MNIIDLFPNFPRCVEFNAHNLQEVPEVPGCYACTDDDDRVLYIGQSTTSIRDRYRSHLQTKERREDMLAITRFYWLETEADRALTHERMLYDQHIRYAGKTPVYNDRHM